MPNNNLIMWLTLLFFSSKSAPASVNSSQAVFDPQWTAACNGVHPSTSRILTSILPICKIVL